MKNNDSNKQINVKEYPAEKIVQNYFKMWSGVKIGDYMNAAFRPADSASLNNDAESICEYVVKIKEMPKFSDKTNRVSARITNAYVELFEEGRLKVIVLPIDTIIEPSQSHYIARFKKLENAWNILQES